MTIKSPLIVFSGLDGSGKSTALDHVQKMNLPSPFKGVMMGHRRPGVLVALPPNGAESGAENEVAHYTKPNRKPLASVAKLGMMTLDWIVGYWGKLARERAEGYIIIFDRHYLIDLDVDPDRYRYGGPLWLVKMARRLVPKPDLVIFLDVPEEISIARKNDEPSAPNFEEQRQAYLRVANENTNWRVVDATRPLATVLEEVKSLVLSTLRVNVATP